MLHPSEHPRVRFGKYEFDAKTGELFQNGEAVKLQPQPVRVLDLLISRAGQLVTREELLKALWPDGTSVEFDQGLNYCIRQIRAALGESANEPTYLETLPKRGYRFIAPVIPMEQVPDAERPAEPQIEEPRRPPAIRPRYGLMVAGLIVAGLIVASLAAITLSSAPWLPKQSENVPRSILVRPFVGQGLAAENAWYPDSMAQQLIGALARTKKVRVLPWSTSLAIQGQLVSVKELGLRFGVDSVLEGYLAKSGEGLRLTVHLLNARTEKTIWTYEKESSDFGRIEAEFMNSVARTLQFKIQEEDTPAGRRPPEDIETYNLYLKARAMRDQESKSGIKASSESYQEVIRRAPGFAPAFAELANEWARDPSIRGRLPYKETLEKAVAYARYAIDLDPSGAEGHAALAHAYFRLKKRIEAEKEFSVALDLDPDSAVTLQLYAIHLGLEGRLDEALRRAKKAALLAPTSGMIGYTLALVHLHAGNYDEAIVAARRTVEIDRRRGSSLFVLSRAYAMKGMIREAMEVHTESEKLSADPLAKASAWRAYLIALSGDRKRAMAELAAWDMSHADQSTGGLFYGLTLLECGEMDRGFQVVRRSKHLWFKSAPELNKWRTHPQYTATAAYFERLSVE